MKTRLTSVTYLGFTAMDRRFSNAMLPWLLREIRSTGVHEKLSIAVEEGCLKAYNGNFEPVIVHRLIDILRASHVPGRPDELFYLLFNEKEALLHCYLFKASTVQEVTELFSQMREPSPGAPSPRGSISSLGGSVTRNIGFQQNNSAEHLPWSGPAALQQNCNSNLTSECQSQLVRTSSNASALTSLCIDLSPSDSHFFEVLYIGKVRISQRKVPETLIDDALVKFAHHEAEKAKLPRRHSLLSSAGTSLCSTDSTENVTDEKKAERVKASNESINQKILNTSTTPLEPDKSKSWKRVENLKPQVKENKEIDDEFDTFSKERVEKNGPSKKGNGDVTKGLAGAKGLGTVAEDEEKNEEIQSIISETASSITQFCRQASKDEGDVDTKPEEANPFKTPEKENPKEKEDIKERPKPKDLVLNLPITDSSKLRDDSPIPNLNFDEIPKKKSLIRTKSNFDNDGRSPMPENKPFLRDRSASIGTLNLKTPIAHLIGEQNRTMLFQVGRSELRLISPDRKQVLLHRAFKDVASCVLGRSSKEHFGFVCRETNDTYACYVFKCESDSIATEVVNAIKQAFVAHADLVKKSREKSPNMTCEHCPMLWYHRLCHDIEGMNEKKSHAFILRRIEQLSDDEQELLITKYQGGTNHMYEISEHIAFLMMLLRAHCESKQQRHVHDTAENRSEFLNQYLGGSTIFMKAKRSLSSGFDHLLKRRLSKDDVSPPVMSKKEASPLPIPRLIETSSDNSGSDLLSPDGRSKSISPVSPSMTTEPPASPRTPNIPSTPTEDTVEDVKEDTPVKNSPMMDIFLKVGDNRPAATESGSESDATWRQAIYEKVLQPPDNQDGLMSQEQCQVHQGKRSKEELRQLWKMAIDQTILLVRMEKENARLKENEESSAVRRIKLEYTELGVCDTGVMLMWDSLLQNRDPSRHLAKVDRHMLTQAVIQGVPRMSRGAVWYFLAEQACLRAPPPDVRAHPLYHTPYRTLLAGLTKHQHSILIDLGRTFPQHEYFASALGPGQLSLYNLLKAYSLLDPDVGYCQGLSFVAGVLLLHMEEAEAFILLRHLMFRRGLRKQYLPDMSALQVQLYQLSRLLRDHEPELHSKLEALDISPALYAAPWMLTLFTSQFPLGFVVRVFDLIFLESLDVVFSVSLALLSAHKDGLMLCESCEEGAEYLKHKLPAMDKGIYEKVMKKILTLDISRQLSEYAVEYAVLKEEMPRVASLTEENKTLHRQHIDMTTQLDSAMDAINNYQAQQSRLETQNKTMEQQLTLLSRYIQTHRHQDPPIEVKKILQTYNKKISFTTKISTFSSKFTSNDEDDDPKSKFKTGVSAPNLFAKISKEDIMNAANNNKNRSIENDRKHFLMKKSQSMHSDLITNNLRQYPLKVLEEKVEIDVKDKEYLTENIKDQAGKKGFFTNTHEQIRQERLLEHQLKHDFDENLKKLDEKLTPNAYLDDVTMFQCRRSMSLNFNASSQRQGSKLNDSGFVTPLSPETKDEKSESCSIVSHPLSDVDVDIKFDGQSTKLKQIRPIKSIANAVGNKNT